MSMKEPIKLEEAFYSGTDGTLYKIDIFGDLFYKNEFGTWTPVSPAKEITKE